MLWGVVTKKRLSISGTFKILTHVNISKQKKTILILCFPETNKINNYNRTFAFVIFYSLLVSFEDKRLCLNYNKNNIVYLVLRRTRLKGDKCFFFHLICEKISGYKVSSEAFSISMLHTLYFALYFMSSEFNWVHLHLFDYN